jgi:hypothetical protein
MSYVRVGDKLIEVDEDGRPVHECWSEEKPNENGGVDVIVHVPCLQIAATPTRCEK